MNLTSLPSLPAGLQRLDASFNQLTSLLGAPEGLQSLDASHNQLTSLQDAPEGLQRLDASHNRLRSLQGAPAGLQHLDVSFNQLTSLLGAPEGLQSLYAGSNRLRSLLGAPEGLQHLDANYNQLRSLLGAPERLQTLDASFNQLTSLLGAPEGLQSLDASFNQLTSLQDAPEGLQRLDASFNQLTSLPEDLLTRMAPGGNIELEGNSLPERVPGQTPARPLGEAVADWLGDASEAAVWQGFAEEEGAPEYARFLDALKRSAAYSARDFQQAVAKELTELSDRPQRRQKCFLLAFGATETCVDRPLEVWHEMQDIGLWADVKEGVYDGKVHELIPLARQSFRMKALSKIAEEKVATLRFVDEVEVHLAYPVKLRKRLGLSRAAPAMQFFGVASVTEADLDAAEARVRAEEATGFADHLSQWEPWETVVSSIAPKAYEAMQEQLVKAMGDEFQERFKKRVVAFLANENPGVGSTIAFEDVDEIVRSNCDRQFGKEIRDEITREIKGDLMRQVLRDKDLEALLDPPAP